MTCLVLALVEFDITIIPGYDYDHGTLAVAVADRADLTDADGVLILYAVGPKIYKNSQISVRIVSDDWFFCPLP